MARRIESHELAGPAGRLEGLLEEPEEGTGRMAALVCHPHPLFGGTLHNKVVFRLARGLRRAGLVVLRFNFRGVGRSQGKYAELAGGIADAGAALEWLRARYPGLPYALAGFSFGARAVMELGCGTAGAAWVLAAGFPTTEPAEYLESCARSKIFIQSTHDPFAPRADFEREYSRWAAPKRIAWIEAADHFFAGALDGFESAVVGAISET